MGGVLLYNFQNRSASLSYRQNYLTGGMAYKHLDLVWPTGATGAAVAGYRHYGNLDYHEQQVTGGYAVRAASWLHVGVAMRYLHLGTSDACYRPQQWLAGSVLLHAQAGGSTTLTVAAGSRPWDDSRPYLWHLTATYRPLPQLITVVEAESEERLRFRLGMEYSYRERIFVRTGFATQPVVLGFGLGIRQPHYAIDLAVDVHNVLGITPHTTLTLWF